MQGVLVIRGMLGALTNREFKNRELKGFPVEAPQIVQNKIYILMFDLICFLYG